jgi:putative flippase GtrA
MPLVPRQFPRAVWSRFPEPLRRWATSPGGRRLLRFAPAAALALAATQITYFICFSVLAMTGRTAGAAGWLAGVVVSYGVSRWAWERKGRPRVFRETLPFVAVSLVVGIVLTEASHFGYREAAALGLHGAAHDAFVQGFYLAANCFTFLTRFVIFHFVLFADKSAKADSELGVKETS